MANKIEEMCRDEQLLEPVVVGVGIFYEDEYVYVNPSFASIFGYAREEIIHKARLVDLVHPNDRDFVADQIRQRLSGEAASARYRARGVRKDGVVIDLELCGARTVYQGKSAVITMILDMTEQVQIAQALRESDERFRKAFDYSSIGMALISIEGQFLKVNAALCTMTGYIEEELLTKTYRMITHVDDRMEDREVVEQLVDGKINHVSYEKRYIHKYGRIIWILINVSIIRDECNVPLYFIAQIQDITERKQTEEMLRKSERLNAVGQLAAGVAHEVRNPLTVLKGFIQLMQAQRADEQQEHLALMLSEVERIEAIITEFLVLAKPQTIRFRTNNLAAIISHVAALISTKAVMNNIQISTRIAADLPHIECDENQIKQVFVNMLQNAVESMPEGGLIMVTAARLGTDRVMIRFIDEGCGIAKERIPHLGEPFYSNKEKGTGLGLMISYKIIENHKGTIKVESRVGKGSVFTIILPLSQCVEKPYES
ncbi:PAS domain-containing sensor histidine kinase [Aneurinibacillus uraniidurans]|uniref:PAS domain-containing sensor histidine kinase n=1 Tax=Aneurinibacillus uraniidurans TaxID=2966586 RepID=UPI002349341B|nr:PAS domain S-box protein [Aneurinibacillus sp. B1]WCN39446.1 PAS domain S-box protein [Aneurinibacillus sp. B1]